jgi:hypothetical protein
MFGAPSAERAAIEALYDAVCTISRSSAVSADGIARVSGRVIAEDIPCGVSDGSDSSAQDAANFITREKRLFVAPETDVRAGDTVSVTAYGRTDSFEVVGIPAVYATHQQVRLIGKGVA